MVVIETLEVHNRLLVLPPPPRPRPHNYAVIIFGRSSVVNQNENLCVDVFGSVVVNQSRSASLSAHPAELVMTKFGRYTVSASTSSSWLM